MSYDATLDYLEKLMKVLHPFMPFISEEIFQNMKQRDVDDYLIKAPWPSTEKYDVKLIEEAEETFGIISIIRNLRNSKNISQKEQLQLMIKTTNQGRFEDFDHILRKMANLSDVGFVNDQVEGALHFVVKADEFYIPVEGGLDVEKQIAELEKELEYTRGFLFSVNKKLGNNRFVQNAPLSVVEMEKKKQQDAETKIQTLEQSIENLIKA